MANTTRGKVLSVDDLLAVLAPQRGKATLVTTNGCFDILHVGHLRYLQAARELGDCLVVLMNSDRSVRNLKGPQRPIVPQEDRAELLAGLACVDYVVLFDEATPETLLTQIRPDVHVKGDQYSEESLPEAKTLRELGTKIEFLPMVAGRSTTNIVDRIREQVCPSPSSQ